MKKSLIAAAMIAGLGSGLAVAPDRPAVRTEQARPAAPQRKKRAAPRSTSLYNYLGSPMMYATTAGKPGSVKKHRRAALKARRKRA